MRTCHKDESTHVLSKRCDLLVTGGPLVESSEAASYVRCGHTNKTSLAISSHEFI